MKLNKNIVLVGMMGSGKSSIGKILSKKLEFEFIDTDIKIEEFEKTTISEIFNKNGEKYFRNVEEIISLKSLKLNNKVIALGGGGYINPAIRKYRYLIYQINTSKVFSSTTPLNEIDLLSSSVPTKG